MVRSRLVLVGGVVVALVMGLLVVGPSAREAWADVGKGGAYVPLAAPYQAYSSVGGAKKGPESTTNVKVAGVGNVPGTGVSAVAVELHAQGPSVYTFFAAWPTGEARPNLLNLAVPVTSGASSNAAVVAVGSGGQISVWNDAGTVHMTVVVVGFFLESGTSTPQRGGFVPVTHTEVADGTKLDPGKKIELQLPAAVVPAANAGSVYLSVRVSATTTGSLSLYSPDGSAGASEVHHGTGASSAGAIAKIDTAGKVALINRGTTAINVWLTAQGYFHRDPASGQGFRDHPARLASGVTLAAHGIYDVQVGGRSGLPTRNLSAALNITVANTTTGGYLKAWPLGAVAPAGIVGTYAADATRSSLAIVKVGSEGKIRIQNDSSAPARIWVDQLGWFADKLTPVPIQQYSRTSVLQLPPVDAGTIGFVEYAFVNNIGELRHGHQVDGGSTSSIQWTTISGNAAFTGPPAMTYLPNKTLQISAQHIDSNVRVITQSQPYPIGEWGPWGNLGGSMAAPPVYGRVGVGGEMRSVLFAVDADGRLWHRMQNEYWRAAGDVNLAGTVALANTETGIQVFGIDTSGVLRTAHYANGTVSAWTSLGGSGLTGTPAVVVSPGYLMRVVVRAADGSIQTKRQPGPGEPFETAWTRVGTFTAVSSPAAVRSPATGKIEIVAASTDNLFHSTGETAQGTGEWREWKLIQDQFGTPLPATATEPTGFVYNPGGGTIWAFVYRTADHLNYIVGAREAGPQGKTAPATTFTFKALGG